MNTGISRDSSKLGGFDQLFARSIVSYYTRLGVNPEKFINTSENALSMAITRDTRNNAVLPSAGSKINIGTRIAGFGGDVAFSNCFSEGIYYYPLFWRTVFKVRANGSLLLPSGDNPIPFDRRILLGGIGSIRGYRYGEIGPKDQFGNIIGGDRSLVTNIEYFFPLVDQFKLNGVAFFDIGNAWNVSDSPWLTDVKAGYGIGVRWISPMGPLRIEYGWKVNPSRGEDAGAFAFAMGQLF
jgi:outer membrane protein insertion porin family